MPQILVSRGECWADSLLDYQIAINHERVASLGNGDSRFMDLDSGTYSIEATVGHHTTGPLMFILDSNPRHFHVRCRWVGPFLLIGLPLNFLPMAGWWITLEETDCKPLPRTRTCKTKYRSRVMTDIAAVDYRAFNDFPNGCCEYSTHFLAHHLVSQGLCRKDEIRMPWNNYDSEATCDCISHGWIMLTGGLNIDISANQFAGVEDRVIVSRDHEVHRRFVGGEVVSFDEHHRRLTCHDDGESFNRAWEIITKKTNKSEMATPRKPSD